MMTVSGLIARLQELPGDLPVVTPGFDEGGYEKISLSIIPLVKRFDGSGIGVPHRFDDPHRFDAAADVFPALQINFQGNSAETLSDAPGKGDE